MPQVNQVSAAERHQQVLAAIDEASRIGGYLSKEFKVVGQYEMLGLRFCSFFRFDNHAKLKSEFSCAVVIESLQRVFNGGAELTEQQVARINGYVSGRLGRTGEALIGSAPREQFERLDTEQGFNLDFKAFKGKLKQDYFDGRRVKEGLTSEDVTNIVGELKKISGNNLGLFQAVHHEKRDDFISEILVPIFRKSSTMGRTPERVEFLEQLRDLTLTLPTSFGGYERLFGEVGGLCVQFSLPCLGLLSPEEEQRRSAPPVPVLPLPAVQSEQPKPAAPAPAPVVVSTEEETKKLRALERLLNRLILQNQKDLDTAKGFFFRGDSDDAKAILKRLNTITTWLEFHKSRYPNVDEAIKRRLFFSVQALQSALTKKGVPVTHPIFQGLTVALAK